MQLFVTVLHIFLCIALILIILLQPGKSDVASAFGGGAGGGNQMYGSRGQGHFLGRATTVVAGMFMVTSITLAVYSSERVRSGSDIEEAIERLETEASVKAPFEETEALVEPVQAEPTEAEPTEAEPAGAEGTETQAEPAAAE